MAETVRQCVPEAERGPRSSGRVLLIENCDFTSFPPGGQLSFSRQMLRAFGGRIALVGATTGDDPVGRWIEKELDGRRVPFFAVGRARLSAAKRLIPARLTFFVRLRLFRRRILEMGARHAIVLAPETMMAVRDWKLEVCYHFSGVENPLAGCRYRWARPFAPWFDAAHLRSARKAGLLLVHADEAAITSLAARSRGRLQPEALVKFPTCVDPAVFHPAPKRLARQALGLPLDPPILVAVGRISRIKGWDLLLEAFSRFRQTCGNAELWFIGDGEDRRTLERAAGEMSLNPFVHITGFQRPETVALFLNAGDVVLFGSHREGWSNAMLEALACGKPLVSMDVSGAREMIVEGGNGFVLTQRDPAAFARAVRSAMLLPEAETVSLQVADRYGIEKAAAAMRSLWPPLREPAEAGGSDYGE